MTYKDTMNDVREKISDVTHKVADEYEEYAPELRERGRELVGRTREFVQAPPTALVIGGAVAGAATAMLVWALMHRESSSSRYGTMRSSNLRGTTTQRTPRQYAGTSSSADPRNETRAAGTASKLTPTTYRPSNERSSGSYNPTRTEADI
ncbi:hypothetical protein [Allohahella marinimesophila]|uniref:DUF3618 domain-containing protein n=1 Tax=Allohahella marinimesophila TaxID=1054972 RepID=A0ABP7PNQ6_9GAMM